MRDVEPEEGDDVERGQDRDREQEQFGPDQERQRVVAEVFRICLGGGQSMGCKLGAFQ